MYMILNQSMTINRIVKWFYLVLMFLILSPSAVNMSRKNSKHGPAIDEEHLKRFPDCGKMPKKSSSRIINSQKAEVHYPWVVQVRRYWKGKEIGVCGGTIITKRCVKRVRDLDLALKYCNFNRSIVRTYKRQNNFL